MKTKKVSVLTLAVIILLGAAAGAVGQVDEQTEWRISYQEQRLDDVQQWAVIERQRIERWYQERLEELWLLAEGRAKELRPAERALWTRFIKTNNELPYANAYFFDGGATLGYKGKRRLSMSLADSYFLTETASFLLDEDAYRLLSWMAESPEQLSLVHKRINTETRRGRFHGETRNGLRREIRRVLKLMDELISRREYLEGLRGVYLADVEQVERDVQEDITVRVGDIKAESQQVQVGLVIAICLDGKRPAAMIEGLEEDLVYEGQKVNGVKVVKVYSLGVEFEKKGRKWVQRIGQKPSSAW